MTGLPFKSPRIWLRSFFGFNPEDNGYIGWSKEVARDRMLGLLQDGDLFMIYGAATSETSQEQRRRVLGFLQVEARSIRDMDKASANGMQRKLDRGNKDKWTYAIPVVRAWRADESILLEMIASETYRPEAGQAIAVWSPPLLPNEVERALKIKVVETNVFAELPLIVSNPTAIRLKEAFQPSRAFPASFGDRKANFEDGPTMLYLARFEGDGMALFGFKKSQIEKCSLLKIGVSNDLKRRLKELNSGFPPAAAGKWTIGLQSEAFDGHEGAEKAELIFKNKAKQALESKGGEFFWGNWTKAQLIFAAIPGVSRFGT